MAQGIRCLLQKHENLILDPQHCVRRQAWEYLSVAVLGRQRQEAPRSLLASQASQLVSSRFGGRSCANTKVEID